MDILGYEKYDLLNEEYILYNFHCIIKFINNIFKIVKNIVAVELEMKQHNISRYIHKRYK